MRAPYGTAIRFVERATKCYTDGCLLWPYALDHDGYGVVWDPSVSRIRRAAVMVCKVRNGPQPQGTQCAHSCGLPRCVNPKHLRWATYSENANDRWRHGTMRYGGGGNHHNTKLSPDQVLEIYLSGEAPEDMAQRHQVSVSTVRAIRRGERWAWLTQPREKETVDGYDSG